MMDIGRDVLHLIFLSEKIQTAMHLGEPLTPDEAILIRQCAHELLDAVPAAAEADPSQFLIPF
jgi:hypothetical protein